MGNESDRAVDVKAKLQAAGFEIAEVPGGSRAIAVKKNNCTHLLESNDGGVWTIAGRPTFNVRGLDCELEDRGYQKFWFHLGRRFPVRVPDLKALHHFDEEVRAILGVKTLYHESLGTTSSRSDYDRLHGRPDE
ncbi:MAG: hypothetical protein ACE145_19905 [Terriglobia bacterium]